jgi:hypothetical protein
LSGSIRWHARRCRYPMDRLVELREHDSKPIKSMPVNCDIG